MAYYLTIDIGNSSAKAAAWHGTSLLGSVLWGDLVPHDIEHLCAATAAGKFDCAAICSVSADLRGLQAAAAAVSEKVISVDSSTALPISLSRYSTAATLGADRMAAMCGAQALLPGQELLVIDCGTAITYDRLSADGEFLGGNIAPGIGMRLQALHAFTARLPQVASTTDTPLWGLSTAQAMQSGAWHGALAEIEYYYRQCPDGTQAVLTGGRARGLFPHLPFPVTIDSDLVLRGLLHIIDYNENK